MCVILVCPAQVRPSLEILQACQAKNPHGAGIAWREGGSVRWLKSNDLAVIHQLSQEKQGELVIHFRWASVGGVCNELRHPFPVTLDARLNRKGKTQAALFQNGTWHAWRRALADAVEDGFTLPDGKWSDTRAAAWLCSIYGWRYLDRCGPSRWVYFSGRRCTTFGEWLKYKDIQFSNLFWRSRLPTVQV
jgi:hypothetical protein